MNTPAVHYGSLSFLELLREASQRLHEHVSERIQKVGKLTSAGVDADLEIPLERYLGQFLQIELEFAFRCECGKQSDIRSFFDKAFKNRLQRTV
jgi:uncharacterized radical SAM superfamily protein